jgi:hypothetical protein
MPAEIFSHSLRSMLRTMRDVVRVSRCLLHFNPHTARMYSQARADMEKASL